MKVLAPLVLTPALALSLASASAETIDKRTPADARGQVEIVNVSGAVRVLGWSNPEVRVQGQLGAGVQRLDVHRDGRHTVVKVVLPSGGGRGGSADLVVHVPVDSSLAINTVSAGQTIEGVRGMQQLQTVSGSIATEVGSADCEAQSVSGDVEMRGGHGATGALRVTTVSGGVRLKDVGPQIEVETVSGDMQIRARELGRARIKTTNGDVELGGALAADARLQAESINGDLRFALREPIDAEFDVETFNGRIDNCFGPQATRSRQYGPGRELRFTQGAGKASVRVKTLNGAVELCRQ